MKKVRGRGAGWNGGDEWKVCKLVGCVVVTEEEQNKLLMGVGSHIEHKPTAQQRYGTVQYSGRVHGGYMFTRNWDFCASQLSKSLSLSLTLYLELYSFLSHLSHLLVVLVRLFLLLYFGLFGFISICFLFVVLLCCRVPSGQLGGSRHSLPIFFGLVSVLHRLLTSSSPSLGAIEW